MIVFGSTGQVASELRTLLPAAVFWDRTQADLTDPGACFAAIMKARPDAVVNAAAYTAVDRAEVEEELALLVNGEAPTQMARACAELDIPFIHVSTDYVFDGSGETPFTPDDPTAPLGAYGRTKLKGEEGVRAVGGTYAILRTSWVFSAHGENFVKTMLRISKTRDSVTIVADQVGGPTSAHAVAKACIQIASQLKAYPNKSGTYHLSGAPDVSWADFAREIFLQAGRNVNVLDIPTSAYPTPARRPSNSRLNCTATKEAFGIDRPAWKADLRKILTELESHS